MITGLYLMYSEDTRFQSACYSAGIHVVGKLKAMHCLYFVPVIPKIQTRSCGAVLQSYK